MKLQYDDQGNMIVVDENGEKVGEIKTTADELTEEPKKEE